MFKQKIWQVKQVSPILCSILSKRLNIPEIVAQLLINRGIITVEAAKLFLSGTLNDLAPPEIMKDMNIAVSRISRSLQQGEKILVYGDYDVDGITATALLVSFLRRLGGKVEYYIPNRLDEGYGLHLPFMEKARQGGFALVITVDCGISDYEIVEKSNACGGPDVIITDHHEVPELLPPAIAVLNPKRPDCMYPFKELAGVGVALKLCQSLQKATGIGDWQDYLDYVCLGTVADIVSLIGENRILVKEGLLALAKTNKPGLQALLEISSIKSEKIDTRQVAFGLAPRINAAGRLGDASTAVQLLLTDNYEEARDIASHLNRGNQQRQKIESLVMAEALEIIKDKSFLARDKVLVLGSDMWHPGVIGIVASKILNKFYRPTLLVSLEGDTGKGSARSIDGFNIYNALEHCKHRLISYGGHAQAAGFSLHRNELELFQEEINNYAESVIKTEDLTPKIELDMAVSFNEINEELIKYIDILAPFGQGNPYPLFACCDVSVTSCRGVGKEGAHLKVLVRDGHTILDGIGFNLGAYADEVATTRDIDVAFKPGINEWNGKTNLQLKIKDLQPAKGNLPKENHCCFVDKYFPDNATNQLFNDYKQEQFIPALITRELIKLNIIKNKGIYKVNTDLTTYTNVGSKIGANFHDWRNCVSRESVLREICSGKDNIAIIVSFPYQALELHAYISSCKLALPTEVLINPLLYADIKDIMVKNPVRIVISTPDYLPVTGTVEKLIFYTLPYHPGEFYFLLDQQPAKHVYMLFNEEDREIASGYLNCLALEREFLAAFYNFLKALQNIRCDSFSAQEALSILSNNGFYKDYDYSISIALAIFKELQLLDYNVKNKFQFKLYPAPKKKLSLTDSYIFNHLLKTKNICQEWQTAILKEEELFKM